MVSKADVFSGDCVEVAILLDTDDKPRSAQSQLLNASKHVHFLLRVQSVDDVSSADIQPRFLRGITVHVLTEANVNTIAF